jgi:hypothetical protein
MEERLFDKEKRPIVYQWESLFSALVKMDPAAGARVIARIEADLQSKDCFESAVDLLCEIAYDVRGWPASLLARLLKDKRAEGSWDAIRRTLDQLRPQAEGDPHC